MTQRSRAEWEQDKKFFKKKQWALGQMVNLIIDKSDPLVNHSKTNLLLQTDRKTKPVYPKYEC